MASFAAVGDWFSCWRREELENIAVKTRSVLAKGIIKWIILSLFPYKSLSVLVPGQGLINGSEHGHHCLVCYRAVLSACLGGLDPGCSVFLPLLQCSVMMLLVTAYLTCSLVRFDPFPSVQFLCQYSFECFPLSVAGSALILAQFGKGELQFSSYFI